MVPTNILQRTFRMKYGESIGTCFTIDLDNRQYIITARHVVEGIQTSDRISLQRHGQWRELSVRLVGTGSEDIDIAVMAPPQQISPTHPLIPTTQDLFLSQDVYFLGFPYGLQIDVGPELNSSYPLPLVKKGIVSSFEQRDGFYSLMLIDGHNNPGFSGGPVYYSPIGTRESRVGGIISGYRYEWEPVFYRQQDAGLRYQSNTGIIVAWSIRHAVTIIQNNPIGALL